MTMKVINDYLDEVDAPSMEPSALEAYTSQMRSGLAEVTQRHIAKSIAQMTAWNWSRGRGIEELTRRFQEEQKKEQIDMSKVLPNAETVVRTESMKILNAEAWRSATEVGSYADGLLWGFSYHAVGDSRTRQTHLAQHGVCAPVDDPFWNEWTPPNGYNCRCWLISEWEEPTSYKQPRRDLHPDPGFAFNPANNVAGRVQQPKKQEQKKPEINTQPQEPIVKPDEPVQNQEISPKYEKNIQQPVTTQEKKRYNKGASSKLLEFRPPRPEEPLIPEVQNGTIIPVQNEKFYAVHGTMVKTTRTTEEATKAILDAGGTVLEENPEIKPDNNPENRKEQENNDSKRGITKQGLQDALEEFHDNNSVNSGTTLIASLLPDGSLVVKDGERVVAEISLTEPSESVISSVNGIFHAIINGSAKVFSKLWLFFKNVSEQNGNADIVETEEEKKVKLVRKLIKGSWGIWNREIELKQTISLLAGWKQEKINDVYEVLRHYSGGMSSKYREDDIKGGSVESNLINEYIDVVSKFTPNEFTFWRGYRFPIKKYKRFDKLIDNLKKGKCDTDKCMSSWSVCEGVAKFFSRWNDKNFYSVVLKLKSSKRIGILGAISANPDECEFIMRKWTKLRLVEGIEVEDGKLYKNYEFLVEEIND